MKKIIKNNSKEMKTEVETFIIEETAELIYDNEKLEAWNSHVENLSLIGQTKIVQKEKSPIPFLFLNQTTKAVFETLLPRKVAIETYDITPIPVEILDLVALSKRESYFDKIEIWYDDKTTDPACIGFLYASESDRKNNYTWGGKNYLIGKWSDVKQSFEQLKERAIDRWKQQQINECKTQIVYYQRKLDDVELTSISTFGANSELSF